MNNQEFYLSPDRSHGCIKIPKKDAKYLLIDNLLSEFYTDKQKEEARSNLGITPLLEQLKSLIDQKVVVSGGIPFDQVPTENSTNILTSGSIYNALLNYYNQQQIDDKIDWLRNLLQADTVFNKNSTKAIANATVASAVEIILDEIEQIKANAVVVDSQLNNNSENPVQNKVIYDAISQLNRDLIDKIERSENTLRELINSIDIPEIAKVYTDQVQVRGSNKTQDFINQDVQSQINLINQDTQRVDNRITNEVSSVNNSIVAESNRAQLEEGILSNRISTLESGIKHIFITQDDYDALESYEKNAIYFVVENIPGEEGEESDTWKFGDNLPIILSGDWQLGDDIPVILD